MKKDKKLHSISPGNGTGVRVVDQNINQALKVWKMKLKKSGKIDEFKIRQEFIKPSAIRRRMKETAKSRNTNEVKRAETNY